MKVTGLRKVAAATLVGTMALSFASCALFGANKKEIVEAADEFASTLLKQDAGKIIKLTNEKKDSDNAEALEMIFDESMYSDEQNEFNKAVADTISYEIDEDSVEVDKEEASVDVTFTMVDYEKALKDDYSDIDEVVDLIKDCDDTKDVKVTFEFEKDDDEWLLSNLDDKGFGKLFDYMTYELDLKPDLLSIVDYTDSYAGSYYLDLYVYFTEDVSEYDGELTFDVYYEGSLIASDVAAYAYSYYVTCEYYNDDWSDLESGNYTVVLKYGDLEIASADLTVDNYVETQPTSGSAFDGDLSAEVSDYLWYYDSDVDGVYESGTGYIELDVYFDVDVTGMDLTFDVYDADGNAIEQYLEPTNWGDSIWCYYSYGDAMPAGEYTIAVYDGAETDSNVVFYATCEVQ
jgi:hypothetical protein